MSLDFNKVDNGKIIHLINEVNVKDLTWNEASFDGIFLKHLVKGDLTDKKLSFIWLKLKQDFKLVNISMKEN